MIQQPPKIATRNGKRKEAKIDTSITEVCVFCPWKNPYRCKCICRVELWSGIPRTTETYLDLYRKTMDKDGVSLSLYKQPLPMAFNSIYFSPFFLAQIPDTEEKRLVHLSLAVVQTSVSVNASRARCIDCVVPYKARCRSSTTVDVLLV